MQQVTRKTLGAGINLTCVTTPKFKRAVLRTMLVLPLGGEDAALRACLPQVLRRGTARLNDMQAFGTALDELYGARIEAANRRKNLAIGFLSDCVIETLCREPTVRPPVASRSLANLLLTRRITDGCSAPPMQRASAAT